MASERRQPSPRRWRAWLWVGAGALVVAGGIWSTRSSKPPPRAERMEYGPVPGSLAFPVSVQTAAPAVRELYEFAARRPNVLHYVPCFCGCRSAGHRKRLRLLHRRGAP